MKTIDPEINTSIEIISFQYKLPANLVRAICQCESACNPWAFRYEPQYRWLVGDKLTMTNTERFGQMCSWGLMQVMGAVARGYGYEGPFPQLCEPDISLNFGCQHLAKFYLQHQNWPDTIASYNAGSPRKLSDGNYVNQKYVTKVQTVWNQFDTQKEAQV